MMDNISAAEKIVHARKSNEDIRKKEHKLGILTPLATNRFENTDFSNPEVIDPRLKTLSAAGLTTSTDLQLINKQLGVHHRQFLKTEMSAPKTKLLHIQDPNSKGLKSVQRITQNLSKLNNYSKSNWSHRDLNKKLLSAPSNVSRNYDKAVNKKNNENIVVNHMKTTNRYDGVASGSPVKREQRLARLRKDYGFVNRNGTQFKTFTEMEKSVSPKARTAEAGFKLTECNTARVINLEQKINYLMLKESKHKKTDTLGQGNKKPPQKINIFTSPFKTAYNCNSQSSVEWSDYNKPRNQELSDVKMNGRAATIDPINPERKVSGPKKLDFSNPKLFRKSNKISQVITSNPNKEYQKAFGKMRSFKRPKGMCSEFAKLSKSQPR